MDRRTFLRAGTASAAIILTPGLLMPVRKIVTVPKFPEYVSWGAMTERQKNYWFGKMVDEVPFAAPLNPLFKGGTIDWSQWTTDSK